MTTENYAYNSVLRYLNHIYSKNKILGFASPSATIMFWVNLSLRSAGKVLGKGKVVRAHTLSLPQVSQVLHLLNGPHRIMFLVGTCALLRVSELFNLTKRCVSYTGSSVIFRITTSKTDVFSAGSTVPVGCPESISSSVSSCSSPLCVLHSLKRFVPGQPMQDSLLFPKRYQETFKDALTEALFTVMGDKPRCTSHAMRRTGATIAFRQGMRLEEIAILGRWSGTETLTAHYLRDASDEVTRIANEVARVWSKRSRERSLTLRASGLG
ncbi:hypothetical protein FOZ61_009760, partial [Perkinsus olseni]